MSGRGGIPTRSKAGPFGSHMWSRRWSSDLESGVSRGEAFLGRKDARNGRVLSLEHSGRIVRCDVDGSQPDPFSVEFEFAPLDATDTDALRTALRREEGGVLGALSGDFSDTVGFLLLPAVHGATRYSCRCPVQPGPCRHVLSAAHVLVEWWDATPEVMFALRGLRAETVGAVLGGTADGDVGAVAFDVEESLWGRDPLLPAVPTTAPAGLEDLLDAPVTRRLAAAATGDPLEQLRVVADLEDFLDAFSRYRPGDQRP
ncbi:MAG: hypothetical protein Q7T31_06175 [Dietzia sp.]|uniref:SWIM-type domain-containing protein n=1 Tax=Dietzia cercidiphylli TaxID=498199 RepID=A0ABP4U6J2_9ACTN|nr:MULTISPECIES: hypothetical protein [Dietzia]MCT1517088.1 hypothetical protein [Dietzia cercidiphylli]MDO8393956.1 hypothetical protein [Dietzia sp.]